MIQLINEIRVEVSEFKGKKYVSIRKWYEKEGEMLPGKGISMNAEAWADFVSKWDSIKEEVKGSL